MAEQDGQRNAECLSYLIGQAMSQIKGGPNVIHKAQFKSYTC